MMAQKLQYEYIIILIVFFMKNKLNTFNFNALQYPMGGSLSLNKQVNKKMQKN